MTIPGLPCPHCGSPDIRRSRRQGFGEYAKRLMGLYPFRCLQCGGRFLGNVWLPSSVRYTSCPKCLRLDVRDAADRTGYLKRAERVRSFFGAHTYRCDACRYTFVSFRKRLLTKTPEPPDKGTGAGRAAAEDPKLDAVK